MKRLLLLVSLGFGIGCDSPPAPPPPQINQVELAAPVVSADEKSVFESRDNAIASLRDRHPDKTFEASVVTGPLRVRVQANGETCERQVPPGTVLGEWFTNLDHTLDRCVADLFEREK